MEWICHHLYAVQMVFCHLSHFQIEVKLTFLLKIVIVFSNHFNKQISYIGKYALHTLPYYTHLAANYPSESQSEEQEGGIWGPSSWAVHKPGTCHILITFHSNSFIIFYCRNIVGMMIVFHFALCWADNLYWAGWLDACVSSIMWFKQPIDIPLCSKWK